MAESTAAEPRGVLKPGAGEETFDLAWRPPAPALEAFVEYHWIVTWDLRGQRPHEQVVLPSPVVHVVFEEDAARVYGVVTGRFVRQLHGTGSALGVRFRPGAFRPFLGSPVSAITDRTLPLAEVFGAEAPAVPDDADVEEKIAAVETFLVGSAPEPDPAAHDAAELVRRIAADPGITRVRDLAGLSGMGTRTLQRLFADYVGVGPKWVIRRCRIFEAVDRAAEGEGVDWSDLAADLGYADQSHFIRDFTALVGTTPARYASG